MTDPALKLMSRARPGMHYARLGSQTQRSPTRYVFVCQNVELSR